MFRYRAMIALLTLCALIGATTTARGGSTTQVTVEAGRKFYFPLLLAYSTPPPPAYKLNAQEAALFAAINAQRVKAGCPRLALAVSLAKAARGHSVDMAANNYFGHTGSDGSRPATRAADQGYTFNGSYEAIAAGQTGAEQTLSTWMGSKPHRDILMNCTLDDGGVGYVLDTDGNGYKYYWTVSIGGR